MKLSSKFIKKEADKAPAIDVYNAENITIANTPIKLGIV